MMKPVLYIVFGLLLANGLCSRVQRSPGGAGWQGSGNDAISVSARSNGWNSGSGSFGRSLGGSGGWGSSGLGASGRSSSSWGGNGGYSGASGYSGGGWGGSSDWSDGSGSNFRSNSGWQSSW